MPTVFKLLPRSGFLLLLPLWLLFACETQEIAAPDFERERILHAFFQPGQSLTLQIGESDLQPTFQIDSLRVRSHLYENGIRVERFSLQGKHPLAWGQAYRLEVEIDQKETLRASLTLPDSVSLVLVESVHSDTVLNRLGGNGYRHRYDIEVKVPANLPGDSVYLLLNDGNSLDLLSDQVTYSWAGGGAASRGATLPAGFGDTLTIWGMRNSPPQILLMGPTWADWRAQNSGGQSSNITPVSVSNVEGGGGVVDFFWVVDYL